MSTERDVSSGTTEPNAAGPRLTPPPRTTPPHPSDARVTTPARSSTNRATATWLTLAFFGVLALAAVAVFVVLPDWVEDRRLSEAQAARGRSERGEILDAGGAGEAMAEAAVPPPAVEDPIEPTAERPATPPARSQAPAPAAEAPPAPPPRPATVPVWERDRDANRRDFERAMSAGLAALERQDYATAREAFGRAGELRPESPQSADGLARAEAGARLATINALRQEALAAEAREDWHAARERYQAALALDSTIEFALDGSARAGRRAELSDRIDYHVANPGRLASDEVLQEAQAILEQASEIDPRSPPLEQQRQRLAAVVTAFSTPVTATLESDQLTEVTVYKVGRLGTFSRRALELRPGTYTVVGSRHGFRDVRHQLVIEPGATPSPLRVLCEEEI